MIALDKDLLSPDLTEKIKSLELEIEEFRKTPLDSIALEKLREHFRTHHIYHSAGIEGNRLTLQETALVLKEGVDISGKPLKDSIEVKNLGLAYDFLHELVKEDVDITENYLKQVHKLLVGDDPSLSPGNYRNIGVIITGSEHRPPEPFEVPIRMMELIEWIKENDQQNPIVVAAIAHHEFVKIHPFKDGNGRTARILLNLILLKKGFPICNIKRDERPMYYESLSLADEGHYEPIVEVVAENCTNLFSEYTRLRDESNRLKDWAKMIGDKDQQARISKAKSEFELWQNRMNQIKLEFKQAVTVIDASLETYYVSFYEYPPITLEKYRQLKESGQAPGTNFFSIRIHNKDTNTIIATFMFRFFRNNGKYVGNSTVIPLELNFFDPESGEFKFIGYFDKATKITLRAFYNDPSGEMITRFSKPTDEKYYEHEAKGLRLADEVMQFFQQVFESVIGLG